MGLSQEVVSELNQKAVVMSATQALVLGRAAVKLEQSMHSSPVLESWYFFYFETYFLLVHFRHSSGGLFLCFRS